MVPEQRTEPTAAAVTAWKAWDDAQWAAGHCSASGLTRHGCHLGPCDCFDVDSCRACKPNTTSPTPRLVDCVPCDGKGLVLGLDLLVAPPLRRWTCRLCPACSGVGSFLVRSVP